VNPEKVRPGVRALQPGDGSIGRFVRPPLGEAERPPGAFHRVVVDGEPAADAKAGVEREGRHEGRRVVAARRQDLGQGGARRIHGEDAIRAGAVTVWIEAGEDGGVRRQGHGRDGDGTREDDALVTQAVEGRRFDRLVAVEAEPVGPGGVERYQDHVASGRSACRNPEVGGRCELRRKLERREGDEHVQARQIEALHQLAQIETGPHQQHQNRGPAQSLATPGAAPLRKGRHLVAHQSPGFQLRRKLTQQLTISPIPCGRVQL
jgi:hypothetical protein